MGRSTYFGSNDHYLYAVNPDGSQGWTFVTGGAISTTPAIGTDGTIYIGSEDGLVYAINPDGTIAWTHNTSNRVLSTPAIAVDGTIYVGGNDFDDNGVVYAFNPDGSLQWTFPTGFFGISASPVVDANGIIYFGAQDNKFYCGHRLQQLHLLWRLRPYAAPSKEMGAGQQHHRRLRDADSLTDHIELYRIGWGAERPPFNTKLSRPFAQ